MKTLLIILMLLISGGLFAQKDDVWVSYYDTVSGKAGYKDLKGNMMLPPSFIGVGDRDSFYNIAAVTAEVNDKYVSYYLLKDGGKVGVDSVYMFDFIFDCESEGKILFYDRKTDKVGFFNKDGKVTIPAMYNAATPFRNGLSFVLQNSRRQCWDSTAQNCEHWTWSGGQQMLINERNEVLIDHTTYPVYALDMYSMKKNANGLDSSFYATLRGRDGNTYSFIDREKHFIYWFNKELIPVVNNNIKNWRPYLFDMIVVNVPGIDGRNFRPDLFMSKVENEIGMFGLANVNAANVQIVQEWYPISREEGQDEEFRRYYKACGGIDLHRYPLFDVIVTRIKKSDKSHQDAVGKKKKVTLDTMSPDESDIESTDTYRFIKTTEGYKLYEFSIRR